MDLFHECDVDVVTVKHVLPGVRLTWSDPLSSSVTLMASFLTYLYKICLPFSIGLSPIMGRH